MYNPPYAECTSFETKAPGLVSDWTRLCFRLNFIAKNNGETKVVGVKIQLIEIMKTGPGKMLHFKDMKKVPFSKLFSANSVVSQPVYDNASSPRAIFV